MTLTKEAFCKRTIGVYCPDPSVKTIVQILTACLRSYKRHPDPERNVATGNISMYLLRASPTWPSVGFSLPLTDYLTNPSASVFQKTSNPPQLQTTKTYPAEP